MVAWPGEWACCALKEMCSWGSLGDPAQTCLQLLGLQHSYRHRAHWEGLRKELGTCLENGLRRRPREDLQGASARPLLGPGGVGEAPTDAQLKGRTEGLRDPCAWDHLLN